VSEDDSGHSARWDQGPNLTQTGPWPPAGRRQLSASCRSFRWYRSSTKSGRRRCWHRKRVCAMSGCQILLFALVKQATPVQFALFDMRVRISCGTRCTPCDTRHDSHRGGV